MFSRPSGAHGRVSPLVLLVLLACVAACSGSGVDPEDEDESYTLELQPNPATVQALDSIRIIATLRDGSGKVVTGKPITWSSRSTGVATVNNGMVKALQTGTTTIVATSAGTSAVTEVTVTPVAVASLTFDPPTATLKVGQQILLVGVSRDANGNILQGRFVNNWGTNNNNVATVDGGVVRGVSPGEARISGTSGSASATAVITVIP